MLLGADFPNFDAETTDGPINLHQWMCDSWAVLFSHPHDFTPVCTTELARVAQLHLEFKKRNVKPLALSCNTIESHQEWIKDILSYGKLEFLPYPIISDPDRKLAKELGMLDPVEKDSAGLATTCRAVFVIDSNKKLRLSILYPATTGRNFGEILRAIDSLILTDQRRVATPADWQNGEPCMIAPTVEPAEVATLFPQGHTLIQLPSKKPYMRFTPALQPT